MTQSIEAPPVSSSPAELAPNQIEVPDYETAGGWVTYQEGREYGVTLDVKDAGRLSATLRVSPEDNRDLYVDHFAATPDAEKGAGKAMISAAIAEGRKFGADTLTGHFTNERALGALERTVGAKNLSYYDRHTGQQAGISFEQAMQKPDIYYTKADISHLEVPPPAH